MGSGFRSLMVYQKGFSLAMEIYEFIKSFPSEEKYGLSSQIRNSSRSVCSNIGEGYRKRSYPAHFISKISDADMENTETQAWLDLLWNATTFQKQYIMIIITSQVRLENY